jgi:glycosyltransferase involved in cell wall biosynthesis
MKIPVFLAMLRIKNEARWLQRVLDSISPLCQTIFVFDDHSTDASQSIILNHEKTIYLASPFTGLNETRDKDWLLEQVIRSLPGDELTGESHYWVLCIDGDEELEKDGTNKIRKMVWADPRALSFYFKILYLWDSPDLVRVDRRYGEFDRPSMFRLINPGFRFQSTPWGGNMHCSSIPQEFLGHAKTSGVALLHYGYMLAEDRMSKWKWYNTVDPGNEMEDQYRHMIQGDVGGPGAGETLKWAGPLRVESLEGRYR